METTKLKKFAQFARRSLLEQITAKLKLLGRRNWVKHLPIPLWCCPISYVELSIEERATIQASRALGISLRHIAWMLGRAPSTISREVRRN